MDKELLYKAASYCSRAEHCESEVRSKLTAWGVESEAEQDTIIDYLLAENYLSEERYAQAFVHDKLIYQGWGRLKLQAALRQKRITSKVIQAALEEINEEEYLQILKTLLDKKAKSLRSKKTTEETRMAVIRFGLSRGFTYDEIYKVID